MTYYRKMYIRRQPKQTGGTMGGGVAFKTFLFLVLAVCLALFYVWQNVQLVRVGYKIKEKEKMVMELSKRSKALEMDLSMLKMPSRIISKIEEQGLNLAIPDVWKVVRLDQEPILYEEDLLNQDWQTRLASNALIDISKN